MTTAFVLGNGVSRRNIDLNLLTQQGKIYGCNALYREFAPDVLVATDKPIATAIQQSGYAQEHTFYTRKPENGGLLIPNPYYGFSSGPVATALAALDNNDQIYLLGFDLGPTKTQQFNNIYADTEFYKPSSHPPTYTGNWTKQIVQIIKQFPNTQFYRICGETTAEIPEFQAIKSFIHQDLATFINRINNKKDL